MKVSLVIPVKNEEGSLKRLLDSISTQAALPDETIIVDAGSTDSSMHIVNSYEGGKIGLRAVSIGPAYPGSARNAGVEESRHDTVAFTDGGIELDPHWLDELRGVMEQDASIEVVYGSYFPRTDSLFKECLALAFVPPSRRVKEGKIRGDFIASSMLKKSVWRSMGGFPDLRAAEDRIFMEKIAESGFRIAYCPGAKVTWDIPQDAKSVFNRFFNYSYHDLRAGRAGDWHAPVLKMYAAAIAFAALGFFASPAFFLVPLAGAFFRVSKKIARNSMEAYFRTAHIPVYLAGTAFLILLIDMAVFAGWVKYVLERKAE